MSSTCSFCEQIAAYHDGELSREAGAQMERHLARCPACAAELAELSALSRVFSENPPPRLSQISLHRLHGNADVLARADVIRIARALQAIAACVLVVASIWLIQSPQLPQVSQNFAQYSPSQDQSQVPPWLDVAVSATAQTTQLDTATPAAAWYLADYSSRSED